MKLWIDLGADDKTVRRRKKVLDKFLNQISTEKAKPKRRARLNSQFSVKELVREIAPDNKKYVEITEEFSNNKFIHTSSMINWFSGGGIIYYYGEGKKVSSILQTFQRPCPKTGHLVDT